MKKIILLFLLAIGSGCLSCHYYSSFSTKERALITSGTEDMPFRILQTTTRKDSLKLRKPCREIKNFNDPVLPLLVERMKTTLTAADGVGIAAPQIGISKSIFFMQRFDLPGAPVVTVINPKIVEHPDTTVCFLRDGCLSIPGVSGNSVRYPWVEVEYYNEKGELIRECLEGYSRTETFTAVIFQHEYDHLHGILFTDKLCKE
ncbi:MAG: peptide deformylase [Prevotellaceae bacterium]|jgi:peptide deformylase|nr:peptide deformylase [Prevotellaceae bacterium]